MNDKDYPLSFETLYKLWEPYLLKDYIKYVIWNYDWYTQNGWEKSPKHLKKVLMMLINQSNYKILNIPEEIVMKIKNNI